MPATLITAEELLQSPIPDKRTDLVRGVLRVREPAGDRHGRVTMNLTIRLGLWVEQAGAGQLFAAETGFLLFRSPDTVRAADIAFVRRERLPDAVPGFLALAPDLVVEVLSPGDRARETVAKLRDWLDAGVRVVWVIDPERRSAHVYRPDGSDVSIDEDETLSGADVLPGFSCRLASVF